LLLFFMLLSSSPSLLVLLFNSSEKLLPIKMGEAKEFKFDLDDDDDDDLDDNFVIADDDDDDDDDSDVVEDDRDSREEGTSNCPFPSSRTTTSSGKGGCDAPSSEMKPSGEDAISTLESRHKFHLSSFSVSAFRFPRKKSIFRKTDFLFLFRIS
jgi:hypothetical protein